MQRKNFNSETLESIKQMSEEHVEYETVNKLIESYIYKFDIQNDIDKKAYAMHLLKYLLLNSNIKKSIEDDNEYYQYLVNLITKRKIQILPVYADIELVFESFKNKYEKYLIYAKQKGFKIDIDNTWFDFYTKLRKYVEIKFENKPKFFEKFNDMIFKYINRYSKKENRKQDIEKGFYLN